MIDKTRSGIDFFDQCFGGVFRHRAALCVGRRGSGKTIAALHALMQSIREGERGLMLSAWHSADLSIVADEYGFPLSQPWTTAKSSCSNMPSSVPSPNWKTPTACLP
ncbi:MAG: hypothetical protein KBA51_08890, partial [Kiritimatiellae bacterium]|nr:hypothetical protein [Kiritimatiellia bacterium]